MRLIAIGLAGLATLLINVSHSAAYELGEHARLTRLAVDELSACFPGWLSADDRAELVYGAIEEDLNVYRKWSRYSHFYHPKKTLRMRRKPAPARVAMLERELQATGADNSRREELLVLAGNLLHHLQDVTSPPHVVPVMHGPRDGYEDFELELSRIPQPAMTCTQYQQPVPVLELLELTALQTLSAVDLPLPLFKDDLLTIETWRTFWQESSDDRFGSYGLLGNNFGKELILTSKSRYEIPYDAYAAFKGMQLRLAIEASKRALLQLLTGYLRSS